MLDESLSRAVRLARIPHYLQCYPQGLTAKELSKLCSVSVRTIQRDLYALQCDLNIPITQNKTHYGILGDYILPPVSFSLYEAVALFLAARLAIRHLDEYNPHVANALLKMSGVLPEYLKERIKKSIESFRKIKKENTGLTRIFEQIAIAWTTQRQVAIQYQSLKSKEIKDWLLEPYFIEMSGMGSAGYVIGYATREGKEGIITFKLNRIKKIDLTKTTFTIPSDLKLEELLGSSWGVIWGDDREEVELRFSSGVTRRVKETDWHPSQVITDLPDGGCLLKLQVSSLMEITPWIRSWGSDVEVLLPASLREEFRTEIEKSYELYGLMET